MKDKKFTTKTTRMETRDIVKYGGSIYVETLSGTMKRTSSDRRPTNINIKVIIDGWLT